MNKIHEDIVRTAEMRNLLAARDRNFRISYEQIGQRFIVARGSVRGRLLVGGYGALGVGRMWVIAQPEMCTMEGYDTAPLVSEDDVDDVAESMQIERAAQDYLHGRRASLHQPAGAT